MRRIDVFNGDADGICALHQLRLAEPCGDADLITGTKRDIHLLKRVQAAEGDEITVLDVSLDSNREELEALLAAGARVRYFDHHFAGKAPFEHSNLSRHIDTAPDICTSLIVDRWLQGKYRLWAVAAAFGDNLHDSARRAAQGQPLSAGDLENIQSLGECLNYNGYGDDVADLWFHPAELYLALKPYPDPRAFVAASSAFLKLREGYAADMQKTQELKAILDTEAVVAFLLPDAAWARRVSGVFANRLAHARPSRAHAVLTPNSSGSYTVSVRAPVSRPTGADILCRKFPEGGGRSAAAGINGLRASEISSLLEELVRHFR